MYYPSAVDIRQASQDIAHDAADLLDGDRRAGAKDLQEGHRFEREYENMLAIAVLECVREGDDGFMGERLEGPDFADGVMGFRGVRVDYLEGIASF